MTDEQKKLFAECITATANMYDEERRKLVNSPLPYQYRDQVKMLLDAKIEAIYSLFAAIGEEE